MLDQTLWAPRGIASTGCRWYLTATWPDCGVINGAKKKGRGSFPEQMPQPQAGKGCVGTSHPCSQETKLMGSCLELQAVCWGEKKPGSGRKVWSISWQLWKTRGAQRMVEQHPPLSPCMQAVAIQITAQPGSVCLGLSGDAGSPGVVVCLVQTGDCSPGHQSPPAGWSD